MLVQVNRVTAQASKAGIKFLWESFRSKSEAAREFRRDQDILATGQFSQTAF